MLTPSFSLSRVSCIITKRTTSLLGSSAVALCGALFAPQAAHALDFDFSFIHRDGGATSSGLIQNLIDNQTNACDGTDACVVSLSSGPMTPQEAGVYSWSEVYSWLAPGRGFTVSNGQITEASWIGYSPSQMLEIAAGYGPVPRLQFLTCGSVSNQTQCGYGNYMRGYIRNMYMYGGTASFAPSIRNGPLTASAPGPLPLLGLAAAFKTSRNVRHRLRSRLG
jgi:hypothetical protein